MRLEGSASQYSKTPARWYKLNLVILSYRAEVGASSVWFSGMENAKYVQSNYTGREEEGPSMGQYLPEKSAGGAPNDGSAWCDLYYQFYIS